MRQTFNASVKKKATNLSLNANLLAEAKDLNINLSATMERALTEWWGQVLQYDIMTRFNIRIKESCIQIASAI